MRYAFTMIELIFIIVIIGILSAVALPKLSTQRSDAVGAKIAIELANCINDAGNYYMLHSSFGHITQADNNQSRSCKNADECFNFVETDSNGSLAVTKDSSATSKECQEAHRIADQNFLPTTYVITF